MKRRKIDYQPKKNNFSTWWNKKQSYDKRIVLVIITVILMLTILNKELIAGIQYIKEYRKLEVIDITNIIQKSVVIRPQTKYIVIHHAAGEQYIENDTAFIKNIENYHIDKGFKTLAYHFVIIKDKIYKCHEIDEKIAGVEDYNSCTLNICVIGDFNKRNLSSEERKMLKQLIYQLKTKNFPEAEICYHKTLNITSCCGHNLIEEIEPYIKKLNNNESWILTPSLMLMLRP